MNVIQTLNLYNYYYVHKDVPSGKVIPDKKVIKLMKWRESSLSWNREHEGAPGCCCACVRWQQMAVVSARWRLLTADGWQMTSDVWWWEGRSYLTESTPCCVVGSSPSCHPQPLVIFRRNAIFTQNHSYLNMSWRCFT